MYIQQVWYLKPTQNLSHIEEGHLFEKFIKEKSWFSESFDLKWFFENYYDSCCRPHIWCQHFVVSWVTQDQIKHSFNPYQIQSIKYQNKGFLLSFHTLKASGHQPFWICLELVSVRSSLNCPCVSRRDCSNYIELFYTDIRLIFCALKRRLHCCSSV